MSPDAHVLGVAVPVPAPWSSVLRATRSLAGDDQAEAVPPHVTLLPPTTVDDLLLPEIDAHLCAAAERQEPFRVRLAGTGSFRPVSPVVFVVVAEGIPGFEALESSVRSGVLDRPVAFPYHPHVTVAHGPGADLDRADLALRDFAATFLVDHLVRYEHLDGRWVERRRYRLGGA